MEIPMDIPTLGNTNGHTNGNTSGLMLTLVFQTEELAAASRQS